MMKLKGIIVIGCLLWGISQHSFLFCGGKSDFKTDSCAYLLLFPNNGFGLIPGNHSSFEGLREKAFSRGISAKTGSGKIIARADSDSNVSRPAPERGDDPGVPPLVITELSYRENNISIKFAEPGLSSVASNNFFYKIEGFHEDWLRLGKRREISVSGLDPGEYVFRVKGSNNDGLWNGSGVSLRFVIDPPLRSNFWFKALLLCIILAGVVVWWQKTRLQRLENRAKTGASLDKFLMKKNVSPREKEVIFLLLQGKSNKEIEAELYISLGTVKRHVHNILEKLGIKNRVQLIRLFKNPDMS